MPNAQTRLLTIDQAAVVLGLKPKTLYQRIWRRQIEHVKLGRNVRFRADVLERMIEESTVPVLEAR
jgi:excisionase family DNA binding protein